jgi:4-carboxymuconolactone decarboxylase
MSLARPSSSKSEPRIPPIPDHERDEPTLALLRTLRRSPDGPDLKFFTTLARYPELLRRWASWGGLLLNRGKLSGRERELLILRTAYNCRCAYEWNQHNERARAIGLTNDEIMRVTGDASLDGWSDADGDLLCAADQLHADAYIDDQTWVKLEKRYESKQLIEICALVGQYHLVAFTLNSLGVEPESWHRYSFGSNGEIKSVVGSS